VSSYVLAGVGLVAAGGFGYFYALGRSREEALASSCSPFCTDSQVNVARERYFIADAFLSASLLALGAAAWITIAHLTQPPAASSSSP
jgi:hypothetical protein